MQPRLTVGQGASLIIVALAAIAAVTVLGALHDLDGQAVVAVISGSFGLVGGGAVATIATSSTVNGKSLVSPAHLETLTNAAARRRVTDTPVAPPPADDGLAERVARIERVLIAAGQTQRTPAPEWVTPPAEPAAGV